MVYDNGSNGQVLHTSNDLQNLNDDTDGVHTAATI